MSMTISILPRSRIFFLIAPLTLCLGGWHLKGMPPSANLLPSDSFIVLSLKGETFLQKTNLLKSKTWEPLVERLAQAYPSLHEILLDRDSSGLKLQSPMQIFARTGKQDFSSPSYGIIIMAEDPKRADQTLAQLAKFLGIQRIKGQGVRYGKTGFPIVIGRKGRSCFLLGVAPVTKAKDAPTMDERLKDFVQSFQAKDQAKELPDSLKTHLDKPSDLAVYIDGTGLAKIIEDFWPDDQWKKLLPTFDPLLNRQLGVHFQSIKGAIKLTATEYSVHADKQAQATHALPMIEKLPGDAPLVVRWTIPNESFKSATGKAFDHVLKFMSNGKITKDSVLPGFDISTSELLSAPSGDFVFAGGTFRSKIMPSGDSQTTTKLEPSFALGIGISRPFTFKQFIAGLNSSKSLDTLLDINELHLTENKGNVWLSTFDYLREIRAQKPIVPLSKVRTKLLNDHFFALSLDLQKANRALRDLDNLSYDQLKTLSWVQDFSSLSLLSGNEGKLTGTIKLADGEKQGWEVVAKHIGQELIDSTNQELFRAVALNDFTATVQAVKSGALINATDRFGHTPLHFTAYKGNAQILRFLLRNGGNPNVRGRHDSTPLHSAAWGRNAAALEVLLEEGSDVNARTDEGETPGMTASLRGEKDILEILFALSADPHAEDDHGTNLIDLAAAGGHPVLVDLLRKIGVKNKNPLHVAAGLGDVKKVKALLNAGRDINERDSFGATPLLIATVSGQEEVVDFLLSRKANPKISATDGYTLMHGAAFSGKKSMVNKALSLGLGVNARYGDDGITPTDVAEDEGDALPYLRALGGRTAWELGREPQSVPKK
jgi:ankyrin repeat protein